MKLNFGRRGGFLNVPATRARVGCVRITRNNSRFESLVTSASANGKRTEVVGKAAAATAPAATAVVPAQMGPQRGDTTGATMVVDDVWVQVGVVASLSSKILFSICAHA